MYDDSDLLGIPTIPYDDYKFSQQAISADFWVRIVEAETDPIRNHNLLTAEFVIFLLVVTGVRMTNYPFAFLMHLIDSELSLLFAEDKTVSYFHARRIVCLPACAADIIILYCHHLARLANALWRKPQSRHLAGQFQALVSPELTLQEQPIGFASFIKDRRTQVVITPSGLARELAGKLPYRIEEIRAQFCQSLKKADAPDYIVEWQVGHMSSNRPTYSLRNQISPHLFRLETQSYLDDLAKELGWSHA